MRQKTAKFIFEKVLGWTAVTPVVPEKKCLIMGVPHTSIIDFPITYLYYKSIGGKLTLLVKEKFFFFPLSLFLKSMGAVPLSKNENTMMQIINLFRNNEECHYAFAPEGTRKAVKRWKQGYYHIAQKAGVPVYLGYFDFKNKRISRGEKFELSDDPEVDMKRMQEIYKHLQISGYHPEKLAFLD